jgi:hypothetical protein
MFEGVPEDERRKITSSTAAKLFKFNPPGMTAGTPNSTERNL